MSGVAALLLAAGEGRRLRGAGGAVPKPLLEYRGESLVRRAASAALASRCTALVAVVGAAAASVESALENTLSGKRVQVVHNPAWSSGIASSIRCGVDAVMTEGGFDAIAVLLADQPHVDAALIDRLIDRHESAPEALVACTYAGTAGAPAIFPKHSFDALRGLAGDRGARALLTAAGDALLCVPFELAATDIDTPEDYAKLIRG